MGRALSAIVLGVAASAVPLATVSACRCAFNGHAQAIGNADWAFVGTVVDAAEPQQPAGMGTATYAFDVERAKAPMESPFSVESTFGNGANCGFDMAVGERWLILASVNEGRPTTNLCSGSTPMENLDPATAALVDEGFTLQPQPTESATDPNPDIPVPVIVAALAAIAVALGSWIAFRRPSPS